MLEKQRTELLESIANDKQSLRDLEDKSLSMLQSSEGTYTGQYMKINDVNADRFSFNSQNRIDSGSQLPICTHAMIIV